MMCLRLWLFHVFLLSRSLAQVQLDGTNDEVLVGSKIQHYLTAAIEGVRDHYVESIRNIFVKLNKNAISVYKKIVNSFIESTQSILSAYKVAISNTPRISSEMTGDCQNLEYFYRKQTYKMHYLLLQCVTQTTREYMQLAHAVTDNIRKESERFVDQISLRIEDCKSGVEDIDIARCISDRLEGDQNPLQHLSVLSQEEMARATAMATVVSKDAYICFGKQTLKVGKEASSLLEYSSRCATEFLQLLSTEPIEGLDKTPIEEELEQISGIIGEHLQKREGMPIQNNVSPSKRSSSAEGDL